MRLKTILNILETEILEDAELCKQIPGVLNRIDDFLSSLSSETETPLSEATCDVWANQLKQIFESRPELSSFVESYDSAVREYLAMAQEAPRNPTDTGGIRENSSPRTEEKRSIETSRQKIQEQKEKQNDESNDQ